MIEVELGDRVADSFFALWRTLVLHAVVVLVISVAMVTVVVRPGVVIHRVVGGCTVAVVTRVVRLAVVGLVIGWMRLLGGRLDAGRRRRRLTAGGDRLRDVGSVLSGRRNQQSGGAAEEERNSDEVASRHLRRRRRSPQHPTV